MQDVVGFGALNLDFIYEVETLAGLPVASGEETKGEGFKELLNFAQTHGRLRAVCGGGSAANTIFALYRLGFQTGFSGKVGKDKEGELILQSLQGVDLGGVCRGGESGKTLILLEPTGERTIFVFPGANDTLTCEELNLSYFWETRFVHLSSFWNPSLLFLQREVLYSLPPEVKVSFDPGEIYASRGLSFLLPLITKTTVFFANEKEINLITGKDARAGGREILSLGPCLLVCKRGKEGALVLTQEKEFTVSVSPVAAVDTTGAGDVFAAGFLAGLLLEKPLETCAYFASAAAAYSVTGYGRTRYPDRNFLTSLITTT